MRRKQKNNDFFYVVDGKESNIKHINSELIEGQGTVITCCEGSVVPTQVYIIKYLNDFRDN